MTDKFLSMDLSSKRKLYACKEDFLTLSRIPSWADYVAEKGLVSEVCAYIMKNHTNFILHTNANTNII